MLGPLLCDLQPSQLRLMAPAILNSSLMAMASCEHIPRHHRAELAQLLYENFGWGRFHPGHSLLWKPSRWRNFLPLSCRDPLDWSAETMEELGSLLLLNDSAITALPNEVGESSVFKCSTEEDAVSFCWLNHVIPVRVICHVFPPSVSFSHGWKIFSTSWSLKVPRNRKLWQRKSFSSLPMWQQMLGVRRGQVRKIHLWRVAVDPAAATQLWRCTSCVSQPTVKATPTTHQCQPPS